MSPRAAVMLLALLATATAARADDPVRVPRRESAALQLELARAWKTEALAAAEGPRRAQLVTRAVAGYRAVRRVFPREPELGAEAAFRAGELLRASGAEAEALAEFEVVRTLAPRGPFACRALLEIGHVHRRAGRSAEALAAYEELDTLAAAESATHDAAGLWSARVLFDLGRSEEARGRCTRLARSAADPVDRVEAYDLLALDWIERGDLEAAAGGLEQCRQALAAVALEETERGLRVRRALERMRALERLRREVARRRAGADHAAEDTPPSGSLQADS